MTNIRQYRQNENTIYYSSTYDIRRIPLEDKDTFTAFYSSCSKQDKEMVILSIYDAYLYGVYIEDTIVGACSVIKQEGIYDIAVLVHPSYRNQKIGLSLVSYVAKKLQDKEVTYQVEEENIYSIKIMEHLKWTYRRQNETTI